LNKVPGNKTRKNAMSCVYCEKDALYRCSSCGKLTCGEHVKLRAVCPSCVKKGVLNCTIDKVNTDAERGKIREFVKQFWGEQEQLTFGKRFIVAELPAYAAKTENRIIGFISFAEADDAFVIVALGIHPKYQGFGVGRSLVEKAEIEAKGLRKKKLLVSASNDDLPALAFYQSLDFQIYEVKPNVIAEKHGKILKGIAEIPIRDELRLQKTLR
jgi:ribosomal protein S18 acetylase RimI-like enzyme